MKIYHGNYIIPGLIVFLIVITFPMWSGIGTSKPSFANPNQPAEGETCIASREYMRANHMQMLNRWRDEVVRDGERMRESGRDGDRWLTEYPQKSLTKTCMACHDKADENGKSTTAATYCIDCHNYVGVTTYCWDCHIDPVVVGQGGKEAE